jgi:hypothetical protein
MTPPSLFRVVVGLRPTHRNESRDVTPAKAGIHVPKELDSRLRGNGATSDGVIACPRRDSRNNFKIERTKPESH